MSERKLTAVQVMMTVSVQFHFTEDEVRIIGRVLGAGKPTHGQIRTYLIHLVQSEIEKRLLDQLVEDCSGADTGGIKG